MNLTDKRLLACAEMVEGGLVCDVGTDHGLLPAYLLSSGKCVRAIAADINPMPLEAARATFMKEGLLEKTELYLSDGLKEVPLEGVTDIVIAGMGGELIFKILSADERVKMCGANFILQPMTRAAELRISLAENGFEIIEEKGASDGRFSYCVMKCRYTGSCRRITPAQAHLGKLDLRREDDRKYMETRLRSLESAAEGMKKSSPERSAELLKIITEIRKEMGS